MMCATQKTSPSTTSTTESTQEVTSGTKVRIASQRKRPMIEAHPLEVHESAAVLPPEETTSFFQCRHCGSRHFELGLSQSGAGQVKVTLTPERDIVIETPKRTFQADLAFMQQFARCGDCHSLQAWEYAP